MNKVVKLVSVVIFCLSNQAFAQGLYLKLELPVGIGLIDSKHLQDKSLVDKISYARKSSGSIKPTILNQFGIGYVVSDYIDTELMYGQLKYSFKKDYVNANLYYAHHNLFGFAYTSTTTPDRQAYCTRTPAGFLKTDEICGGPSSSGISSLKIAGKLNTFIGSVKLKPLKQIKSFSPYISMGAGIAFSNSQYRTSLYSAPIENPNFPSGRKKARALGLEFGAGTKIQVTKGIDLDCNVKYFDYGNHILAHAVSKKINGYKFSIGMTFLLM